MQSFEFPIEQGKIREFAEAIGDDNPIYRDPGYAQKTKFRKILAPPTLTVIKTFWGTIGTYQEIAGFDNRFVLHGEEEFEYFEPILAGDVLTCTGKIAEAYEKAGKRGGKMAFVVFESTFFNQKGEQVLISRSTIIQTGEVVKN